MAATELGRRIVARQEALLAESVRTMPQGPYRDFARWVLAQPGLRERWLHLCALPQLTHLTETVLKGLCPPGEDAVEALARLNVYFSYETFSDNLAIRLDGPLARVLRRFCAEAVAVARGSAAQAAFCLEPQEVWLADQCLHGQEAAALIGAHTADPERVRAVNRDVGPPLTANLGALRAVCELSRGFDLFRRSDVGWHERYQQMLVLLDAPPASFAGKVALGAQTVNVVSTLAFYLCVIGQPDAGDELVAGLRATALKVRLLNDIGTALLEVGPQLRRELCDRLTEAMRDGELRLGQAIAAEYAQRPRLMTRLGKDVLFGESNVCLDGLRERTGPEAVEELAERLALGAQAYARAQCLEPDRSPAGLICRRFVDLHRRLYAADFAGVGGEFSVALTG